MSVPAKVVVPETALLLRRIAAASERTVQLLEAMVSRRGGDELPAPQLKDWTGTSAREPIAQLSKEELDALRGKGGDDYD